MHSILSSHWLRIKTKLFSFFSTILLPFDVIMSCISVLPYYHNDISFSFLNVASLMQDYLYSTKLKGEIACHSHFVSYYFPLDVLISKHSKHFLFSACLFHQNDHFMQTNDIVY